MKRRLLALTFITCACASFAFGLTKEKKSVRNLKDVEDFRSPQRIN